MHCRQYVTVVEMFYLSRDQLRNMGCHLRAKQDRKSDRRRVKYPASQTPLVKGLSRSANKCPKLEATERLLPLSKIEV